MAKSKGPLSLLYPFLLAAFVLNCHCNEQHRKVYSLNFSLFFLHFSFWFQETHSCDNMNLLWSPSHACVGSCCVHGRSSKGRWISCISTPQHAGWSPWQVNYNTKIKKEGNIFIYLTQKPLNCNSYVENNEMSVFNKPPIHAYQFYFFKEDSILTLSWDLIIFKYSETFEYVPVPVQSILGKRITTSQLWKEF